MAMPHFRGYLKSYVWWLLLIGPALCVLFPALPFLNDGHCDPWYEFGIFQNLPLILHWYPHARQPGRITEVLPGYILTHLFAGIYADYAQFLLYYTISVVCVYKTAKLIFNDQRAVLAGLFFALSPIVVGNYGVTYSAPVVTYETLAFFCAARAAFESKRNAAWMFLSGIAWGAGIIAHLYALVFGGFIYIWYAISIYLRSGVGRGARIATIAAAALSVTLGVLVLTAVVGACTAIAFNVPLSTILDQVTYAASAYHNNSTEYWDPKWYFTGPKVGMFLLALIVAGLRISEWLFTEQRSELSNAQRYSVALSIAFVVTFVVLCVDEMAKDIILQEDYYFVFLWPFLALTIFAFDFKMTFIPRVPLALLFFVAFFVGISLKTGTLHYLNGEAKTYASAAIAVACGALIIVAMAARAPLTRAMTGCAFLLMLSLTSLAVRPHHFGYQLWDWDNSTAPREAYRRVHLGLEYLGGFFSQKSAPQGEFRFWTNEREVPDGLAYARSFIFCGFQRFPNYKPTVDATQQFNPGQTIIVIARSDNIMARVTAAFDNLNLHATVVGSVTIPDSAGPYDILVTVVSKK